MGESIESMQIVSVHRARTALARLCNSAFRRGGEKAVISIPADPRRDDDLVLSDFINQAEARETRLAEAEDALAEAKAEIERLKKQVRDDEQLIKERDDAEDAIGHAYCIVVGHWPEWSNAFGHDHAIEEINEKIHDLITDTANAQAAIAGLIDTIEGETLPERQGAYRLVGDAHLTKAIEDARKYEGEIVTLCRRMREDLELADAELDEAKADAAQWKGLYEAAWVECEAWRSSFATWNASSSPIAFFHDPYTLTNAHDAARRAAEGSKR